MLRKPTNTTSFIRIPFGEASKKGAASTFGGVSTSDSDECRPCGLDVVVINIGEMSEAAGALTSFTAAAGNLTQQS